ncbi:MAG: amidohydrolase [Gammaproteobacteria bacterium]|nr:amidohydrolase [Gammaproteobacteria bacterium]
MQPLTVSIIQTETRWHSPADNRALFERWFAQLPEDAQVVVLPEMFSTGFTMSSAEVAEPMDGPTVRWLQEQAAELGKVICGSLVIAEGGRYYNRFCWVDPAGNVATYDKRHRFRMANEHGHYSAGSQRCIIGVADWRVCPMICYDLRFPVWFRNRSDYDVLLCVANWPAARQHAWNSLLRARAIENQCYAVGLNIVGVDGNEVAYTGGSAVYSPEGHSLLEAGEASGVFTASLDGDALEDYRSRFPAWQDADAFSLDDEKG